MTRAEVMVSRYIHGDILRKSPAYTETIRLEKASRVLPLEHSPITEIENVTVENVIFTNYTNSIFCLRTNFDTCWPANTNITVTYRTGWEPGNYPDDICEAIAMIETWLLGKPETGIAEQTIGPFTTRRNESGFRLPESVMTLLHPWVRPLW